MGSNVQCKYSEYMHIIKQSGAVMCRGAGRSVDLYCIVQLVQWCVCGIVGGRGVDMYCICIGMV